MSPSDTGAVGGRQPGAPPGAPASFHKRLRNSLVLAAAMLLLGLWWSLHIKPFLSRPLVAGTALSVAALLAGFLAYFKLFLGEDFKKLPSFLVAGRTRYYAAALAVAAALLFVTSSVYVTQAGEGNYEVKVTRDGNHYMGPLRTAAPGATVGGPFFCRFGRRPLTFTLDDPLRAPRPRNAYSFSHVAVRVPHDFPKRPIRLLQVLPGKDLHRRLRAHGDAPGPGEPYRMEITRVAAAGPSATGASAAGAPASQELEVPDLRRQPVVAGATRKQMELVLKGEPADAARAALEGLLGGAAAAGPLRDAMRAAWQAPPAFAADTEFAPGDSVDVVVWRGGVVAARLKAPVVLDGTTVRSIVIDSDP